MYSEILNERQKEILPLMSQFRREYYLVGGTAIALYIGHRRSIDFDLFKFSPVNHKRNLDKLSNAPFEKVVTRRVYEQMNLVLNGVKVTFFQYPFPVQPVNQFENYFRMPSLLQLAAMKAYALGRRSKWKDYVDMYFLLSKYFTVAEICDCAAGLFGDLFSEKMFRSQLCYFEDIDYSEEVDYMIANPPTNDEIQQSLIRIAMQGLE